MRTGFRVFTLVVCLWLVACSDSTVAPADGTGNGTGSDAGGDISTDVFSPVGDAGEDSGVDAGDEDSTVSPDAVTDDTSAGSLERFEPCGLTGPQCEPPLQCLGSCQLPCGDGCPEGEACIEVAGPGSGGVCGVRVSDGEGCNPQAGTYCDEGLLCNSSGQCEGPDIGGEGASCDGFGTQCEEGLTCVITGIGEGVCQVACDGAEACGDGEVCVTTFGNGACYEDCDPPGDTDCSDEAFQCREPIGGGETACLPRFGDPPGDQGFGDPCGGDLACGDGLFCPGLSGSYCTRTCGADSPCPEEPAGAECVNFGFGPGLCSFTCPGGGDDECPEGMSCVDFFGQSTCAWQ